MEELYKCKKCGHEFDIEEVYCPMCKEEAIGEVKFTSPLKQKEEGSKRLHIILIICAGILLTAVILGVFLMKPYAEGENTDHSSENIKVQTEVPNFIGNTEQRANEKASMAGLRLDIEYEANDKYDEGQVFYQEVEEMTKVDRDSHIKVKIATSNPVNNVVHDDKVIMPSLTGLTMEQAGKELDVRKLKYEVVYLGSDEVDEGYVISQTIEPGSMIDPDTDIYLSVCKKTERVLEKITMEKLPERITYFVDENRIDFNGLQIRAFYTDGSQDLVTADSLGEVSETEIINNYSVMGSPDLITVDNLNHIVGTQTLTVYYRNKTTTFDVNIVEDTKEENVTLASIKITKPASVTEYSLMLEPDEPAVDKYCNTNLKGLEVTAYFSDGTERILSPYVMQDAQKNHGIDYTWQTDAGCSVSNINIYREGKQTVEINYYGKKTSYEIVVLKNSSNICLSDQFPGGVEVSLDYDGILEVSGTGIITDGFWNGYINSVKKIVINKGITGIENTAFNRCCKAVSITIPESVENIQEYSFKNWTFSQKIFVLGKDTVPEKWINFYNTSANIIWNP